MHLNGRAAGHGYGNAIPDPFHIQASIFILETLENFGEQVPAIHFEGDRGDGAHDDGIPAETLNQKSVPVEFRQRLIEKRRMMGRQVHRYGDKQTLGFDRILFAGARNLFIKHPLMGDMLVDNQETFGVAGDDVTLLKLTEYANSSPE